MRSDRFRYRSPDEDSARWTRVALREGDIVISTRSKSGTTWLQMICALLVFGTPDLPEPLWRISPWLDWLVEPIEDVVARLDAQRHRRIIKTHTPLDGIPLDPRVTYVVAGRHPLDIAVSLYHQSANIDRDRVRELTGAAPAPEEAGSTLPTWLHAWLEWDGDPRARLDSLPGIMWHLTDAWVRRATPNVVLVHYDDLLGDLDAQMRAIARRLGIGTDRTAWPALVDAARFEQMRARAHELAPDPAGVLVDRTRFFRQGTSGAGRASLPRATLARYAHRVAELGAPDLVAWLHRG